MELVVKVFSLKLGELGLQFVLVHRVTKGLPDGVADLSRNVHLFLDLIHCLVDGINRPWEWMMIEKIKEWADKNGEEQVVWSTYMEPWMPCRVAAPWRMALMASRFTVAPSMVINCVSKVMRAPDSLSTWAS